MSLSSLKAIVQQVLHAGSHNVGGTDTPIPLKYLDKGDLAAVAVTFDWTAATTQRGKMTGNWASIAMTAPPAGTWVAIIIEQDATGGRVLPSWPAAVIWTPSGTVPTFTTTASKKIIVSGVYDGTNYILSAAQNA